MIFLDYNTTGDGVLSALQVVAVMKREGKKLSQLATILRLFPQVLRNVPVAQKKDPHQIPEVAALIKKTRRSWAFEGEFWFVPRVRRA
jgi:phosphoglucosamine mutase